MLLLHRNAKGAETGTAAPAVPGAGPAAEAVSVQCDGSEKIREQGPFRKHLLITGLGDT